MYHVQVSDASFYHKHHDATPYSHASLVYYHVACEGPSCGHLSRLYQSVSHHVLLSQWLIERLKSMQLYLEISLLVSSMILTNEHHALLHMLVDKRENTGGLPYMIGQRIYSGSTGIGAGGCRNLTFKISAMPKQSFCRSSKSCLVAPFHSMPFMWCCNWFWQSSP